MGRDDDFRCRWLKHPLRNFQRGSTWRSNYDPLTAPNRVVDDLQFLPRISVESIVNRNSGTIGILKGCCYSLLPRVYRDIRSQGRRSFPSEALYRPAELGLFHNLKVLYRDSAGTFAFHLARSGKP